jgi:general secretion pathway protein I
MKRARGFTLLEVLIALAIVALSAGALLGSVTSSASNVIYLKEKTLAEWVALNRLTEVRISKDMPSEGRRKGSTTMGGMRWEWEEEVTELPIKGMLRVEVRAHNTGEVVDDSKPTQKSNSQADAPSSPAGSSSAKVAWTSTAVGVVGSSTSKPKQAITAPMMGTLTNNPQQPPGGTPPPGTAPPPKGAPTITN